jgi:hypothetical protein
MALTNPTSLARGISRHQPISLWPERQSGMVETVFSSVRHRELAGDRLHRGRHAVHEVGHLVEPAAWSWSLRRVHRVPQARHRVEHAQAVEDRRGPEREPVRPASPSRQIGTGAGR